MQLLTGKYGHRQSQIERQYQGRRWAQIAAQAPADEPPSRIEFSTPDETLIGLGPVRALLLLIGAAALIALVRERNRLSSRHTPCAGKPSARSVRATMSEDAP
jgi:hypothetical protein